MIERPIGFQTYEGDVSWAPWELEVEFIGVECISDLCEIAHQAKKIPQQNRKRKFPGKKDVRGF